MRRELNQQDMQREAVECFETVVRERERMDAERRDGLYYDDEPSQWKVSGWTYFWGCCFLVAIVGVALFFARESR